MNPMGHSVLCERTGGIGFLDQPLRVRTATLAEGPITAANGPSALL
jgi:hypothetical protein